MLVPGGMFVVFVGGLRRWCRLRLVNVMAVPASRSARRDETAWWHPMHLHGHSVRVISRNGKPNPLREWRDTVLMPAHENAEIAFVADNPGDWMLHCHVTDHQEAGMMSVIRVA